MIPIANRSKTYGETLASGFDYATGINGDTLRVLTASQGAGPAAPVAGNDYTIVGAGTEARMRATTTSPSIRASSP